MIAIAPVKETWGDDKITNIRGANKAAVKLALDDAVPEVPKPEILRRLPEAPLARWIALRLVNNIRGQSDGVWLE